MNRINTTDNYPPLLHNLRKYFSKSSPARKQFSRPSEQIQTLVKQQLRDYWNNDYSQNLLSNDGKHWLLKVNPRNDQEANFSLLANLLAKDFANVPEVKILTTAQLFELQNFLPTNNVTLNNNSYLIRLAQDYQKKELAILDFDEAIAAEIAFSIWIGRRDAHASNRALAKNIPIFFDFDIAFGYENEPLIRPGPDAGYVTNWRYFDLTENAYDLITARQREFNLGQALIPIKNRKNFETFFLKKSSQLKNYSEQDLYKKTAQAGFNKEFCFKITQYLLSQRLQLDTLRQNVLNILLQ